MKRSPKWPRVSVGLSSRVVEGSAVARRKLPAFPMRKKPLPAVTLKGDAAAEAICAVVRRIPRGWVATYGQVATMAGMPRRARLVGRVLQHLDSKTNVPWHRVVNAKGETEIWKWEGGGTVALVKSGVTRETIKAGQTLSVTGNPLRDRSPGGLMRSVILEDGTKIEFGDAATQ